MLGQSYPIHISTHTSMDWCVISIEQHCNISLFFLPVEKSLICSSEHMEESRNISANFQRGWIGLIQGCAVFICVIEYWKKDKELQNLLNLNQKEDQNWWKHTWWRGLGHTVIQSKAMSFVFAGFLKSRKIKSGLVEVRTIWI